MPEPQRSDGGGAEGEDSLSSAQAMWWKVWSMGHKVGPMDPLEPQHIWAQGVILVVWDSNSLHGPQTIGHQNAYRAKKGPKPKISKNGHGDGQDPKWPQGHFWTFFQGQKGQDPSFYSSRFAIKARRAQNINLAKSQ
ncbi:hypothetical protein O181_086398 [Austropuccinia psidii MF-1]|uniref:Uncharacterized protein n=1 Tax=Austropuccinia psidii MF-1 TaxID=1389203 RepID=A0A9Q3IM69_9BASI|nr:hypothetical protein [Austropuccinia psidii MF-1]